MKQEAMACNSMQLGSMSKHQLRCHCFSAEAVFTDDMPAMQSTKVDATQVLNNVQTV